MVRSVAESWVRFETALPKLGFVGVGLSAGASERAIRAFEAAVKLELPAEVREFFRGHDGQTSAKAGLAAGFHFVSLREAEELLMDWTKTRADLGDRLKDLDRACSSAPPRAIQRKYSLPGWVPLLRDGEGNAIGVDLDPGPNGTIGQIINFGRDEDDKFVLFSAADDLMCWLAEEIEAGRVIYDRADRVVRHVAGRLVAAIVDRS
jgi:cell wall assembly regulator SMI1